MTPHHPLPSRKETNPAESPGIRWGLALLGGALLGLQLILCERISSDGFRFCALCAVAFGFLIWPRRGSLTLESDPASSLAGVGLIAFFLVRSAGQSGTLFATIAPLIWGTGLALLASGARGLRQYWREAIVLAAVVVTPFVDTLALDLGGVDLAPYTARTTAMLLRLGGWDASARDVLVGTPTAWVVVSQGCSGLKTMYFLGGFSVLVMLMFPIPGLVRKLAVAAAAVALGYLINALRVALLVLLAGPEHRRAFRFWHIQQGAMIFEIVAVMAFCALYYYAVIPVRRTKATTSAPPRA